MLTLRTLGRFNVFLDGAAIFDGSDPKRGLLLVYLLEKGHPQNRLDVARLLWPGGEDSTALANLRSLLLRMRRDGLERYLLSERSTISITNQAEIDYDVAHWRASTANAKHASFDELFTAADLYQGDFLPLDTLDDYPLMDEWASAVRTELETQAARTIATLAARAVATNQCHAALPHTRKLSDLMSYNDDAQLLLMRVLAGADEVAEALHHFHEYRRRMQEEMGIDEISPELEALRQELSSPRRAVFIAPQNVAQTQTASQAEVSEAAPSPVTLAEMPLPTSPHIGRRAESTFLAKQLDGGARLITILGMGGTGKSMFLRNELVSLSQRFGERIRFLDLRAVATVLDDPMERLLYQIATTLEETPFTDFSLLDQVVAMLHDKVDCLILDNCEANAATSTVIEALLQRLPHLVLITTSRTRLHVRGENVLVLRGLPTNAEETAPACTLSDAAQLLIWHLQREQPDFVIDDVHKEFVDRICDEVDGLPTALILAAQQASFYGLSVVAAALPTSNELLHDEFANATDDHQNIDLLCDHTWQSLTSEEQSVLTAATVFAEEFHRDALHAVVTASRNVLSALIDSSLLRTMEAGWFALNPLMRRYLAARYDRIAAPQTLLQRHKVYFLEQLHLKERLLDPVSVSSPETFAHLHRQHQDLFAAWRHAVADRAWDLLQNAVVSLGHFAEAAAKRADGIALFQMLLDHLPAATLMTSSQQRLAGQAAFFVAFLHAKENGNPMAEAWHEEAVAWLEQAGTPYEGDTARRYAERVCTVPARMGPALPTNAAQKSQPAYV